MAGITEYQSKLPGNKTSIFSVMSKMANDHNAINLSQGFPNFETDQKTERSGFPSNERWI